MHSISFPVKPRENNNVTIPEITRKMKQIDILQMFLICICFWDPEASIAMVVFGFSSKMYS